MSNRKIMQQALEVLERAGEELRWQAIGQVQRDLRAALAEQEQEPFGYLWPTGMHPEFRFTQQQRDGVDGMPVYVSPAPTAEDIAQDWDLLKATQESLREHMAEIQRLRAALAEDALQRLTSVSQEIETALAEQCPHGVTDGCKECYVAEQEPVAWMDREGDLYKMPEIKNWAPPHTMLYTAPPQRQWVGLTDEERDAIANSTIRIHGQEWAYATAIEAKLKEKNT